MDSVTHQEVLTAIILHGAGALATLMGAIIYFDRRLTRIETVLKMMSNGKPTDAL